MEEGALLKRAVIVQPQGLNFALAAKSEKPVLILCPHSPLADNFLKYQAAALFDCKQACLDVALWKRRTIADVRAEARATLRTALSGERHNPCKKPADYINLAGTLMKPNTYSRPLWLSFGTSAFHLSGLVHEKQGLPSALFTQNFSQEDGVEYGLLSQREASSVDRHAFPFRVILTSQLSITDAEKYLAPVIPGFQDMVVILVDTEGDREFEEEKWEGVTRKEHGPLPAEALEKVEAAILSQDEHKLKVAIAAAKDHWSVNGRYLSLEETGTLRKQGRVDKKSAIVTHKKDKIVTLVYEGVESMAPPSANVARLQAAYTDATVGSVLSDTAAVEAEAWTLLEVTDWVELDEVWLELASNADEDWEKL